MNNKNIITIDESKMTLENVIGCLKITKQNCEITLKNQNQITGLWIPLNAHLDIKLEDFATLEWNDFWTHQNTSCSITIYSSNETKLKWNINIEAEKDYDITLENQILGNKNESKIIVHVVTTKQNHCKIKSIGKIEEKTQNNVFMEELKGLELENQTITFLPDLIVNSNDVVANHNATIKCINEEELFYLKSKGLDEWTSKELIKNGFLKKKSQEVKE